MARQLSDVIGYVTINGQKYPVQIEAGFRGYLQDADRTNSDSFTNIGSILSGVNSAIQSQDTRLNTEVSQRVNGDQANAGTGDGTGVSDSRVFSSKTSNGTTWTTLATCTVTPTGAGNYTFTFYADALLGHLSDEHPTLSRSFSGNWRIMEDDGVTPVELDSGTFTVTHTPRLITSEAGLTIEIPEYWTTTFSGLPSSPIANNYDSAPIDLTFEIQRASGSNEVTSPGLSGSFSVSWA